MSAHRKTKTASERVRQAYRRLVTAWQMRRLSETDSGLADLQIDAGMLVDGTGLVYSRFLKDEGLTFVLKVPAWSYSEEDILRIEHSRDQSVWTVLHEDVIRYFEDPIDNPHPVELDRDKDEMRLEGTHYFRSWVQNLNPDTSWSKPLKLIFDRFPPYNYNSPSKFPNIPVVTDQSLLQAGDKAVLMLPAYSDWAEGDMVHVYWMNRLPEDAAHLDAPVLSLETTGAEQALEISGDAIRKVGDGGVFVVYLLVDKAGNVSEISVYTSIAVALGELPTIFAPPVVPLATLEDQFLIDQADANEGVEVWVPVYDGMKSGDFVDVKWGDTTLPRETVGSATEEFIRVNVPNEVMQEEYGDGPGPVSTKVSYTLLRGSHPMGAADTDIKVDFETMDPDGPHLDWPLPIHPGLEKVVITGQISGRKDELDESDAKLPAKLAFKLYGFAKKQDELTFYWGDEVAKVHKVRDTDTPGELIDDLTIPWDVIEKVGNHAEVAVYYEARRDGVQNPVQSPITLVKVDAITITPVAATFEHLVNGRITCTSIKATAGHSDGPAVEVQIPDLSEYQDHSVFTEIDVKWWVYPGIDDSRGDEEIDDVRFEERFQLDNDHPVTGFIWRIPFHDYVEPTVDGSGEPFYQHARANVTYTLKMERGAVTSEVAKVRLSFIPPAGVCDPDGP